MAYGTPRGPEEAEPFYAHIRGGRPPSPELLANLRARYEAIGGHTPLLDITRRQAEALELALGQDWRVYVGMKHWHPYIADTLAQMAADGIREAVALALAPHYSDLSVGAYIHAVDEAQSGIDVRFVRSWHLPPSYLEALREHIREASDDFDPQLVLLTAHSLPKRILDSGDPYVDQLHATAHALALSSWKFSFQSAGATGDAWLGPDILQTIDSLEATDIKRVLVAPIGFISDHLEILYDIDVQAKERATLRGIELRRIQSLNDDPRLVAALKEAVLLVE